MGGAGGRVTRAMARDTGAWKTFLPSLFDLAQVVLCPAISSLLEPFPQAYKIARRLGPMAETNPPTSPRTCKASSPPPSSVAGKPRCGAGAGQSQSTSMPTCSSISGCACASIICYTSPRGIPSNSWWAQINAHQEEHPTLPSKHKHLVHAEKIM